MLAQSDRRRRPAAGRHRQSEISAIPSVPRSWGQLVRAIQGIAEACRELDFPIVSGNVSLYNETNGRAIPPTPTIAGVGLIEGSLDDGARRLCGRRRAYPPDRRP